MKRRIATMLMAATLALTLGACGQSPKATTDNSEASQSADATATTKSFSSEQYGDVGEGSAYLVSGEGTTENGSIPELAVNPTKRVAQVTLVLDGVPADKNTYVYVDGQEAATLNESSETADLELKDEQLTSGEHSVEFVQFDSNKPSGQVTFYRVGRYMVN